MLKVKYGYTESHELNGQPRQVTAFHCSDNIYEGHVVGYPSALPPFARVIFTSPQLPEHVKTYEKGSFPDFQTPGVISDLVNQAIELVTVSE